MESISKSPQPAVGLCSGNVKQLRKQAWAVHAAPLLQLRLIFGRIRKCPMCTLSDIIQNNSQSELFKRRVCVWETDKH